MLDSLLMLRHNSWEIILTTIFAALRRIRWGDTFNSSENINFQQIRVDRVTRNKTIVCSSCQFTSCLIIPEVLGTYLKFIKSSILGTALNLIV